ncbi:MULTISPECIES: DUF5362 domain-containing protein [Dyella]|jgi:hypothetical protein|uniref:DUF5362 domain-containing protein n=1 Tax=Dyella TaxID=231454 RepID=UPI000C853CEF|nr:MULTISPECIES: DUF5362 domain-containing protein [Dyella]MDR3444436.1 DUF5362 domain-containing protein [Dyella sp.]PMQ05981.1 hypothetical protein DyAD56_06955 [Dyella sp. AD56]ULU25245.1 DUF5362 protein [Dyella terrae]
MSDSYSSLGNAPSNHSIQDLIQPLASGKGWMKFLGIVFIIGGALYAITIVGIIIAWLPIWIGVLLLQSAGALERAQVSGDVAAMKEALTKLRSFFVIQGVMMIVGIALWVLALIFYGAVFAAMLHNGGSWR